MESEGKQEYICDPTGRCSYLNDMYKLKTRLNSSLDLRLFRYSSWKSCFFCSADVFGVVVIKLEIRNGVNCSISASFFNVQCCIVGVFERVSRAAVFYCECTVMCVYFQRYRSSTAYIFPILTWNDCGISVKCVLSSPRPAAAHQPLTQSSIYAGIFIEAGAMRISGAFQGLCTYFTAQSFRTVIFNV